MIRRTLCLLLLLAPGCAMEPPPRPSRAPAVSHEPPSPRSVRPTNLPERLQQEAWMTRFWSQLTSTQRRRVQARLTSAGERPVNATDAARSWDAMGLPERDALIFGAGTARPDPPARPVRAADPPEPGTPEA